MIETVLGVLIILYGTVYALFLLRAVWKDRANAAEEPGTFWKVSVCEAVVYFFTTMGVPDFILNTTVFQSAAGWTTGGCRERWWLRRCFPVR